jgi:hypothetical protein
VCRQIWKEQRRPLEQREQAPVAGEQLEQGPEGVERWKGRTKMALRVALADRKRAFRT